jgi:hypothetical protein
VPCARNSPRAAAVLRDLLGLRLESLDEQPADGLALDFRVVDAFQRAQEKLLGLNMVQRNVVMVAEEAHDFLRLAEPQQAVVDEHAGEPVADRLVDQHGRDRGIDAAGEAADHPALADLRADLGDLLLAEGAHGPVAAEAGDLAHEVADEFRAVGRVHHFGVEHQAVIFARLVLDDRERRVRRGAGDGEARRHPGDAVAMAHPDLVLAA